MKLPEVIMKYALTFVALFLVAACNGQVKMPGGGGTVDSTARANIAALQNTINAQAQQIAALQARPVLPAFTGDSTKYLSAAGTYNQATGIKTVNGVFAGSAWEVDIYAKGVTSAWRAEYPIAHYATKQPLFDVFTVSVVTDTVKVLRLPTPDNTPNLPISVTLKTP
jgi:hypothetical protein